MAKRYDINFLNEISEKLTDIPDYSNEYNNEKTLTESIEILKPLIKTLSKKGYKASLISELLITNGIEANQQYLQKLVQKTLSSNKKTRKQNNDIVDSDPKSDSANKNIISQKNVAKKVTSGIKKKTSENHSDAQNNFSVNDDSTDL